MKLATVLLAVFALAACRDVGRPVELPDLDANYFRCNVGPVLQERCGLPLCHGDRQRPFRIYAPNRLRLVVPNPITVPGERPPLIDRNFPLTTEERQANFDVARGFARGGDETALIVAKPLDLAEGGAFHRARDLVAGRDVFANTADLGYRVLLDWVRDSQHPPDTCTVSEEVGP